MPNIYDKIAKLAGLKRAGGFDQRDRETLENWSKMYRHNEILSDLKNHDGLKLLLERALQEIESIKRQLQDNRDLTDTQRSLLFGKRDMFEWLIDLFVKAEKTNATIEKEIDKTFELNKVSTEGDV